MCHHDREGILAREWRLPGERVIHHGTQCVDIGPGVERAVADRLLGGHEHRRAADGHVAREIGGARVRVSLTSPKSSTLDTSDSPPRTATKTFGGLQVAVHEPDAVRLGQPGAHLAHQVNDTSGGQRTVVAHQVAQALALKVFHHIIERSVAGETVIEDFDRVGVRKPSCRLHFALEPRHRDRVGPRLGLDQLEGTGRLSRLCSAR